VVPAGTGIRKDRKKGLMIFNKGLKLPKRPNLRFYRRLASGGRRMKEE